MTDQRLTPSIRVAIGAEIQRQLDEVILGDLDSKERRRRGLVPGERQIRYTEAQAAEQLAISVGQLDRLRRNGEIVARIDAGRVYFGHDELVAYAKCRPSRGDISTSRPR